MSDDFEIVPGDGSNTVDEVFDAIPDDVAEHAEAAAEAQERADEAVAAGDYESAAEFRATAEEEAGQAGDESMLHGSSSTQLVVADEQQDQAEALQQQSAEHAAEGNYEAARQDAADAATLHSWADQNAGGSDHSGLAEKEEQQLDWAAWEQETADGYAQDAEAYAAIGDMEHAEQYADAAGVHQDSADAYGDAGEHGGDLAVTDSSSQVVDDGSTAE